MKIFTVAVLAFVAISFDARANREFEDEITRDLIKSGSINSGELESRLNHKRAECEKNNNWAGSISAGDAFFDTSKKHERYRAQTAASNCQAEISRLERRLELVREAEAKKAEQVAQLDEKKQAEGSADESSQSGGGKAEASEPGAEGAESGPSEADDTTYFDD